MTSYQGPSLPQQHLKNHQNIYLQLKQLKLSWEKKPNTNFGKCLSARSLPHLFPEIRMMTIKKTNGFTQIAGCNHPNAFLHRNKWHQVNKIDHNSLHSPHETTKNQIFVLELPIISFSQMQVTLNKKK